MVFGRPADGVEQVGDWLLGSVVVAGDEHVVVSGDAARVVRHQSVRQRTGRHVA